MNELLIYITGSLLIMFWVAEPLLRSRTSGASAADQVLQERVDALLESLRKMHDPRENDRLLDKDFENIERRLMLELAKIYERQGVDPNIMESLESCACGSSLKSDYAFCPGCGRGLKVA